MGPISFLLMMMMMMMIMLIQWAKKNTHTINKYTEAFQVSSKKIGAEVSTTEDSDGKFMSHEKMQEKSKCKDK